MAAASAGSNDEEHDERMRAVRSSLRELIGADPAVDAALAADRESQLLLPLPCPHAKRGALRNAGDVP